MDVTQTTPLYELRSLGSASVWPPKHRHCVSATPLGGIGEGVIALTGVASLR
jgi:hypothetical protein